MRPITNAPTHPAVISDPRHTPRTFWPCSVTGEGHPPRDHLPSHPVVTTARTSRPDRRLSVRPEFMARGARLFMARGARRRGPASTDRTYRSAAPDLSPRGTYRSGVSGYFDA